MKKEKKSNKCLAKKAKGITLIALVVTIVVLLILASVSITVVFGDNGLIEMARKAADKTNEAVEKDLDDIQNLTNELNDFMHPPEPPKNIAEAIEQEYEFTQNTQLKDEFGNPVTIPAGFHIVMKKDDPTVDYNYSKTNPGTPTVQDGIVVADKDGNQFVWIPVGEIKNDTNGKTTTITLGRYTEFTDNEVPKTIGETIDTLYKEETKSEHESSEKTNAIAKNITDFVNNSKSNGGYYLARYEASYGGTNKPLSKPSEGEPEKNDGADYAPSTDDQKGQLWNNISQPNASIAAQGMYEENENYTSDLTNSYAWDTAIVFIQKYSGDGDYSKEVGKTFSSTLRNTGAVEGGTADKRCNIYDMASNCSEWTTETSFYDTEVEGEYAVEPWTRRGGSISWEDVSTSSRSFDGGWNGNNEESWISFRAILYVTLEAE